MLSSIVSLDDSRGPHPPPTKTTKAPSKRAKKTNKQKEAPSRSKSRSRSPTPFPSPRPPPQSEHPSAHEFNSDSKDGFGTNHSTAKQRDESELLPAIDPMIDSMDAQFRQDNPSRHFDGESDESVEPSDHPKCIVPLAELAALRAMTNLDDEHYQQALKILATPGGPISFLVMKELERQQEQSNTRGESSDSLSDTNPTRQIPQTNTCYDHCEALKASLLISTLIERIRQCSKDAFLESNLEMYTRGSYKPGTSDFSLLTITVEKLMSLPHDFQKRNFPPGLETTSSVRKSFVTLVRDLQTHFRCSIREKLLCGVGNITPGLVLPRLHEIAETIFRFLKPGEMAWSKKEVQKRMPALFTSRIAHIRLQTLDHLLHPPLQKRVSQWTLIDEKLKDLKAHGSDYRAAFYKAILIKDQELFGTRTPLADIDSDLIVLPSEEEVLTQLAIVLGTQSQPGPSL
ncbi:hypothetical protein PSTG_05986 [Puccinia striiformis f. sp. tritici PST-78]|uniref:Uncharacterized protein n=2 Tax=Puccinia striiformis f. sp. tritici TaxID=168172 RepID=A0A0L0VNR7_9BASI|nr:hypothetical protein PSTG_05986 [Puccinia striiformis f. sp. tritici PST-78]